jgi:hypothetical protein
MVFHYLGVTFVLPFVQPFDDLFFARGPEIIISMPSKTSFSTCTQAALS